MSIFKSSLGAQLSRFLNYKRGLGFAYRNAEGRLRILDRMASETGVPDSLLDEPLARRFVSEGTRGSRSNRLTLVRQFARFLAPDEPRTFIPPRRFLGVKVRKPVIRVLARDEVQRFLVACDKMTDSNQYPHRGLIHGTLLSLLLMTGLRRGEALALKVADVDLNSGVLSVKRAKFGKSRFVPVAEDVLERLRTYHVELGKRIDGRCSEDAFFPGPNGHVPGKPASLYASFRRTLDASGIDHGGRGKGPRLHDLRHSFALLRLLAWYEQGADLNAKLPLLATYLGHIGLGTTQVYLHMTRDLVGEVSRRFDARFGHIITAEVGT